MSITYPYPHILLSLDFFIYVTLTIFVILICIYTSTSIDNSLNSSKIKDFKDLKSLMDIFRIIASMISYCSMFLLSITSCCDCSTLICYVSGGRRLCWKRFSIVLRLTNLIANFASFLFTIIIFSSCVSNKGNDEFKMTDNNKDNMNKLFYIDIVNIIVILILVILCIITFSIYMKYFRSKGVESNSIFSGNVKIYSYEGDCFPEDCSCEKVCGECNCSYCCVQCCDCSFNCCKECCDCSLKCMKECLGCLCCCWCCFGCCGCDYCMYDDDESNNNRNNNNNNNRNINNNVANNQNNYNYGQNIPVAQAVLVDYNNPNNQYNQYYADNNFAYSHPQNQNTQNVQVKNNDNFYTQSFQHFKHLISEYYVSYELEGTNFYDAVGMVYLKTINNLKSSDNNAYNQIIQKPLYEMIEGLYPYVINYLDNDINRKVIKSVGFATKTYRKIRWKTENDVNIEKKFQETAMKIYAVAVNNQRMNN